MSNDEELWGDDDDLLGLERMVWRAPICVIIQVRLIFNIMRLTANFFNYSSFLISIKLKLLEILKSSTLPVKFNLKL
jgi:hypothetical protein